MGVNGVVDYKTQVQNNLNFTKAERKTNGQLDKNAFLYILTTELANQDPMNAKDNTEYVAQLAQFSALEQMQNLNVSMNKILLNDKIGQGTLLVGHEVTFSTGQKQTVVNADGSVTDEPVYFKGFVKSTRVEKGDVVLLAYDNNNKEYRYSLDDVIEVGDYKYVNTPVDSTNTKDSGKQTTNTTGDQQKQTETAGKTQESGK